MRNIFYVLLLFLVTISSCNKDEGPGGSSSIEGYVYNVVHRDDNFSFTVDTVPAIKEDVFLVFGDDGYFGDDVETDRNGLYRFNYLRKGNYTVYAYSEYADGSRDAISKDIKVRSGTERVENIYIHTGKANGTSMIKGSVYMHYYDKGSKVDEGPAISTRVYIKNFGEETHFDDVRVGDQGVFIFQKILPGKYEIWVPTEDPDTEKLSPVKMEIEVDETGKIYELPRRFVIITTV
ncbi:MAG: carboxypeptidase-like regulatory domain-containing protein [Bacteroidales bacterium]|jgi:hypothetical protein|nr:carboxypeptidase-like regulatory domain-containing protein [Bacteroidales bacterium]